MKKQILFLFTVIFTFTSYAQTSFEKGYYITNSGEKVDCFIKNKDWKNTPSSFEFSLSENGEIKTETIKTIKEFGIYNVSKFIKSTVSMDRSTVVVNDLTYEKNPIFNEEELFLKVLIEGKANLYVYEDGNLKRFFFRKDNSEKEQLVFKKYLTSDSKLAENNHYKQQLSNSLQCESIPSSKYQNLQYTTNSLVNFFSSYNKCSNSDFTRYENNQSKAFFNLTLRPSIRNSSLNILDDSPNEGLDFGSETGFGIGLEIEYTFPFNNNKWSVLAEPTYQSFKQELTQDASNVSGGKLIATINYTSIEIPIGARHYFFLTDASKIFINASFVLDIHSSNTIELKRADNSNYKSITVFSGTNAAFGIGYKYNNKYSLEARYQTSRRVVDGYRSEYQTTSLIFGYSFL